MRIKTEYLVERQESSTLTHMHPPFYKFLNDMAKKVAKKLIHVYDQPTFGVCSTKVKN